MYTVLRNIEYGDDVTMDHAPCTIDHGIQNLQLYTAVVRNVMLYIYYSGVGRISEQREYTCAVTCALVVAPVESWCV